VSATDQAKTVTALIRDVAANLRAARAAGGRHSPAPPAAGLVIDIGSGQTANPRADVVVDKYVTDDFERGSPLDLTKPLVVGDGHCLPFANDTFAYVVASHVLEHATDPILFAAELSRIGQAGFIQVPTRQAELTFGWPFHPWLIDRVDDTLIFNPRGSLKAHAGDYFHHSFAESTLFQVWFSAHRDVWHHSIHWNGSIAVRVSGDSAAPETAALDVERARQILPSMGAKAPEGRLRAALRCPSDQGSLADAAGHLTCSTCGRSYPVAGGVPILLGEAAT
jgi:uncharacterized protein YbaR (Trm112 family)